MKIALLQHIVGFSLKSTLSDCGNHLSCICTKCSFYRDDIIFNYHENSYISYYENLENCCDPWNSHYRHKKVSAIDIGIVIRMNLKPDQNICNYCVDSAHKNNEKMDVYAITEDLDTSF